MNTGAIQPSMDVTLAANRYAARIKLISILLIVLAIFVFMRTLPIGEGIEALRAWISELGVWGAVVYGAIYVLATVFLLPGFLLTVAAGAIFGILTGTIIVSIAATTGVALTFLISRYFARETVANSIRHNPKFDAIDKAIGEGGWKIVAMLRLSPAVPFNLQNYAYGLTSIGFWTCVLTSWLFMLPGTFMYVYLGNAVGLAAFTAAGVERERTTGELLLFAFGLLATIAVTVYITIVATRAVRQHTAISSSANDSTMEEETEAKPIRWPWGATVTGLIALLTVAAAGFAHFKPDAIQALFSGLLGPPTVVLEEKYAKQSDGASFDHSVFNQLLKEHVSKDGWVDYVGLRSDATTLDSYIDSLAEAPFDELGRDQKLALLINAYNAFTLRLILDYYPIDSIKDIPTSKRWDDARWNVGGNVWSLNQIEHEQIRPKFREPRIHFALVCAAVGCPILRNEAYVADRLEDQLKSQTEYVHNHDRWFRYDATDNTVHLTKLYDWYGSDFEQVADSVIQFVRNYAPAVKEDATIRWLDYNWDLNELRK